MISQFESNNRSLKTDTGGRKIEGATGFRIYLVKILRKENGSLYDSDTYATSAGLKKITLKAKIKSVSKNKFIVHGSFKNIYELISNTV